MQCFKTLASVLVCTWWLIASTALASPTICSGPLCPGPGGWIEFQRKGSGIEVPVKLNGVSALAIIDNASTFTVVSPELAQRAGLRAAKKVVTVRSWGTPRKGDLANKVCLALGDNVIVVRPLIIAWGLSGPPREVILGRDVLDGHILEIAFDKHRLRLSPRKGFSPPPGFILVTKRVARVDARDPAVANIRMSIESREIPASLDLGSEQTLHISKAFFDRYHLGEGRKVSAALSGSLGGFTRDIILSLKNVALAGEDVLDVPTVVFLDDKPSDARAVAVIGLPLIERFHFYLDARTQALWLKPLAGAGGAPFPRDLAGLGLVHEGDRLKVMFVAPGSPAAGDKWQVGDEVISIDGVPASEIQGRRWKEGPIGETRRLTMADGITRELTLRRYF